MQSSTDKYEPTRTKLRNDSALPIITLSNTDRDAPNLHTPTTDNDEASREKLRSARAEPPFNISKTAKPDPSRTKPRSENVAPMCMLSITDREAPSLSIPIIARLDAMRE